jgi:hypothetical protein
MQLRRVLYVVATLIAALIVVKSLPEPSDTPTRLLTQIGGERYRSPAGLIYGPGSQHGHRLKHVLAHGHDEPNRSGPHGVFNQGDEESIVRLIDEAYLVSAERGESRVEDGRRVLTVDMGRTIGYVGGQVGIRAGHPKCNHIRIILEGSNVITAYPLDVGPRDSDE